MNLDIIEGVLESPDLVDMAVRLRQEGWQLLAATTIDKGTYDAELRLLRWQKRVAPTEAIIPHQTGVRNPVVTLIHRISGFLTRLFFPK